MQGQEHRAQYRWIPVILLFVIGAVNILDRSTLAIGNSHIRADLNLSAGEMGLLLSAFSWAYAFSQLPLGALLDRTGARRVLGIGLFIWSIAQVFGGLSTSFRNFVASRILLGVAESPTYPAGAKVIAEYFPRQRRGKPTAVFLASTTLAPAITPPLLTWLMLAFGWRQMFVIMGVTGILVSLLWMLYCRSKAGISPAEAAHDASLSDAEAADDASPAKLSWADFRHLFAQATTWGMMIGFGGVIYLVWFYLTWLPGYLEHERHLAIGTTGWVLSIPYVFACFGGLLSGYVGDKLMQRGLTPVNSRKWMIAIALVVSAGFTFLAARAESATLAVGYLCVVMFFLYVASSGAWTLVNVVVPKRMIASVGALQNFGGYFGGSFAPIVTGYTLQYTNSLNNAFVVAAMVGVLGAAAYVLLVRKQITGRETLGAPSGTSVMT
jgi:sugar phosphate permease